MEFSVIVDVKSGINIQLVEWTESEVVGENATGIEIFTIF